LSTTTPPASPLLLLPEATPVRFKRNLVRQAVCELRFPTLYSLEATKPPAGLATALRKKYLEHGVAKDVAVGPTGVSQDFAHVFTDKKSKSSISLKSSALTIETAQYVSFEDFKDRILEALSFARRTIDSEILTRVGLRYINTVPYSQENISDWVNPELVRALRSGAFGDIPEYHGRIAGERDGKGFAFSHGIGVNNATRAREYVLDIDMFAEGVLVTALPEILDQLHADEFKLFLWTLGPAAYQAMGPATSK